MDYENTFFSFLQTWSVCDLANNAADRTASVVLLYIVSSLFERGMSLGILASSLSLPMHNVLPALKQKSLETLTNVNLL